MSRKTGICVVYRRKGENSGGRTFTLDEVDQTNLDILMAKIKELEDARAACCVFAAASRRQSLKSGLRLRKAG
jgi:hypothetical protein